MSIQTLLIEIIFINLLDNCDELHLSFLVLIISVDNKTYVEHQHSYRTRAHNNYYLQFSAVKTLDKGVLVGNVHLAYSNKDVLNAFELVSALVEKRVVPLEKDTTKDPFLGVIVWENTCVADM